MRRMRHRLEHDDELRRQLQRQHRLFARRQFERVDHDLLGQARERFLVEVDAELQKICLKYSQIGSVLGSCAAIRLTRGLTVKGDFHLFVDRGLVTRRAQRAIVIVVAQRFQVLNGRRARRRSRGTAHSSQIEQPEPRRVQEAGNHPLFVEPGSAGEVQGVDPVELVILALLDQPAIASTTAGSAVCLRTENWAWVSLMVTT